MQQGRRRQEYELAEAGVRRMLNADGELIKSNNQHVVEYGEKMFPTQGEEVSFENFILPETFRAEVCQGFDYKAVCSVLLDRGCLFSGTGRSFDSKQRPPCMRNIWAYRIPPAIFDLE